MLIRVADPSRPAFQLRPGEEGISVFDTNALQPPLTEAEVLEAFRPGSKAIALSVEDVENKDMKVVPIPGASTLPQRLRDSHAEIQPTEALSRKEFKNRLKELE